MKYNYRFTLNDRISIVRCQEDVTKLKFWQLTDISKVPNKNQLLISGTHPKGALMPAYMIRIAYIKSEKHYNLSALNLFSNEACNEAYLNMYFTSLREAILKACDTGLKINLYPENLREICIEEINNDRFSNFSVSNNSVKVFSNKDKLKYTITRVILTKGKHIGKIGYQIQFGNKGKIKSSTSLKWLYSYFIK